MFEKAKKRFIRASMLSISAVFLVLVLLINGGYIVKTSIDNDKIANMLIDGQEQITPSTDSFFGPFITKETIFDTRYFKVTINEDDEYTYDLSHSVISKANAEKMASAVVNSKLQKGYISYYRFIVDEDSSTIIFLNCESTINRFETLLFISSAIYIIGLILVYLLIRYSANKVLKPVKDSYEKQKQFITNASHELKTPLTIISANNELIEIKNGQDEYTSNIDKQVKKMTNMVKDLTTLSKMQEIEFNKNNEFNLSNLVNSLVETFKSNFEANNIKLNLDIENDINVKSDPKLIEQALSILLDNANKYSKKFVNVNLIKNKRNVSLIISNDCEYEDEDLNYLTERFYRKDKDRSAKEGSGIGLSLLKEITNNIGAKLNIYCENKNYYVEIIL